MNDATTASGLQLRSVVTRRGELELSLVPTPTRRPQDDEVLVRVEAAPINPSDLALMVGGADLALATQTGTPQAPVITVPVPAASLRALTARLDRSLPVGNEGAGVVVAAGSSPAAQRLIGRTVAVAGGAMFAQYRVVKAAEVLELPEGVSAAEGASSFVNPLTALGFVETMRREGHTALINTAAASNLGQMLVKLCLADGIELVNIVRSPTQARILRDLGAHYVCDSSAPTFMTDLVDAVAATGATIGFDAIGGGTLAGQMLTAMEIALTRAATTYSPYGSTTHKQVYIYGGLDPRPTELSRGIGMSWGVGGWLVSSLLAKIGAERAQALRARAAADLRTIFASRYTQEISLAQALDLETLRIYRRAATGEKYMINPNKGLTP
jgi:NADPH:quinone reductase